MERRDSPLQDLTMHFFDKRTYRKMTKWYEAAVKNDFDYVVFVVRRSYVLATILERITGIYMQDSSQKKFLTDASIVLHCEEMAECFRNTGVFPKILLCDDLLIHGRNLNNVITSIQERLFDLLPETDKSDIVAALVNSIRIKVIAKLDDRLLLLSAYAINIECELSADLSVIHSITNSISELISYADVANATFVFSERITKDQFNKVDVRNYYHSRYQNIEEYTDIDFIEAGGIKAIFTIRIIKKYNGNFRVVPFVFLPQLSPTEVERLLRPLFERLKGSIKVVLFSIGNTYIRSRNEFLTMILSQTLLEDFNKKYGIVRSKSDEEREITKLARNYNFSAFSEAKSMLLQCIKNPVFKSREDVLNLLIGAISKDNNIFQIKGTDERKTEKDIKERMENFFYVQGCRDEIDAYQMIRRSNMVLKERKTPSRMVCNQALDLICNIYNKSDAKQCIKYFLQLMDAGILALTVSFSSWRNKMGKGYFQTVKAGEQALIIYPLRMDCYMYFIRYMDERYRLYNKDIKEHLRRFAQSEYCRLEEEEINEICDFLDYLELMGHKPGDWDIDYIYRLDVFSESWKDISSYYERKKSYLDDYKKYLAAI